MGDCLVVTQVTSFSRSGLSDWLIQRVSSLIMLAYFLFIGVQIGNGIDYTSWRALHDTTAMKVFTLLATGAYVSHAWIGLWTVFTDYLTEYMLGSIGNVVRPVLQIAVVLALVVYAIWIIQVIWG
jgi:succinate dehydrogenase / fumarate reductase membrane anchor subunit